MIGWDTKTIGELCDVGGGKVKTGPFGSQLHQSDYSFEGTPVVMPTDINNGSINTEKIARVNDNHVLRLEKHKLSVGDIIYGRRGDIGRQALVRESNSGWLCGTGCLRITLGDSDVIPEYLHLFLKMPEIIAWIQNQAIGATMPNLNTQILRRVPIHFPKSKNIQKKIIGFAFAYDDLIENNKRRIALLEKMAEEIYREWFVRFRFPGYQNAEFEKGIPKEWVYQKLDNLCSLIKRGISPKYDEQSKKLVINQKCIRNGRIDLSLARAHDTKTPDEKYIKLSDALINSTGVGTLGRVSVVEFESSNITVDSHVTICRANPEMISPAYLAVTIAHLQNYFEFMASGSTGQVELNRSLISGINVLVPSPNISEKFSNSVFDIWENKRLLLLANENLEKTKKMLLPRLISGKLPVADLDIQFPPSMQTETKS